MSTVHTAQFPCPACGEVVVFPVWSTLIAQEQPLQAKQLLEDGNLFEVNCPQCRGLFCSYYPLVYVDYSYPFVIKLAYDLEEHRASSPELALYDIEIVRVVSSIEELKEKVLMIERGFDDRVLEIVKLLMLMVFAAEYPGLEVKRAAYELGEQQLLRIYTTVNTVVEREMILELYAEVKERFAAELERVSRTDYHIDQAWAQALLQRSANKR